MRALLNRLAEMSVDERPNSAFDEYVALLVVFAGIGVQLFLIL